MNEIISFTSLFMLITIKNLTCATQARAAKTPDPAAKVIVQERFEAILDSLNTIDHGDVFQWSSIDVCGRCDENIADGNPSREICVVLRSTKWSTIFCHNEFSTVIRWSMVLTLSLIYIHGTFERGKRIHSYSAHISISTLTSLLLQEYMQSRKDGPRATEIIYMRTLLKMQQKHMMVIKQKRKEEEERRAREAAEAARLLGLRNMEDDGDMTKVMSYHSLFNW